MKVNVLVDLIAAGCKPSGEEILRILGTELAIITANELREKRNGTETFTNEVEKLRKIY